jgi:hypothetical protein
MYAKPTFIPYLFDSKEAWERTIADPRYKYDLKMDGFMEIYTEHRQAVKFGRTIPTYSKPKSKPIVTVATPEPENKSELLSQDDIDLLINQMTGNPTKTKVKELDVFEGMMSQDDLEALFNNLK